MPLKVASWNVRTLLGENLGGRGPRSKTALLAHELDRYGIDVAALSETRLSGEGSVTEGNYTIFWRGYPEGTPRQHGVGIAIRNCHLRGIVEEPNSVNERLMTLRVPLVRGEHMLVISAYAPTLMADEDQKDLFYHALDSVLRKACPKDKIVLMGDFNARVGSKTDLWGDVIGAHGIGKMNSNGLRLLSTCSQHNLAITNTFFRLKLKYKTSWMHPRSKRWHLLDYIIVRRSQVREVYVTRAMRGADCWTDHRLIVSKIRLKIRPSSFRSTKKTPKINLTGLNSDTTLKKTYEEKVKELIHETGIINATNINEKWETFAKKLTMEATNVLGKSPRKHRDWYDENDQEIKELLKHKNQAHLDCLRNPTSPTLRQRFAKIRSQAQRQLRILEDTWWQQLSVEIQGYADKNNIQQFYESTKRIYGPRKRSVVPVRSSDGNTLIRDRQGILARWAEHFSVLLNAKNPTDHSVLDDLPTIPSCTDLDTPPTLEEVVSALKGMKPRKAAGPDGVPAELLTHGGTALHTFLHEIITVIWENAAVPNSWKDAILITIYKNKGDKSLCGNSRGIALLGTAGKVFARILLKRLVNTISESVLPESQCGFRANRSTIDMIFAARQLLEKSREQHRSLYVAFIDLSKAFNSVDRNLLWKVLEKAGCTKRFVNLVRCLHDGMTVRIRIGNDLSEPFEVSRGVKQGCVLAPVLFNIYVQCITRLLALSLDQNCQINLNYRSDRNLFDHRKMKAKTKVTQTKLLELQYADDCAMVADSIESLQSVLSHTSAFYQKLGLNINIGKTEYMEYHPTNTQTQNNLHIDNNPLNKVNMFKYLGSHISANGYIDDEVHYRVKQANSAFGRLSKRVFHNKNLTLATKVMVYNAVVLSSLLYGSETWTLYSRHLRTLENFHMTSLRKILGISWIHKIPNSEVLRRTKSVSLENIIFRQHLRWLGHTIRMDDSRLPKQLLYGELSEGKRSVGRQVKRYKDQSLSVLKACHINSLDLEAFATDRVKWRVLCNNGLRAREHDRLNMLDQRRTKRKARQATTPAARTPTHFCPVCGRGCLSPIGLISHSRVHKKEEKKIGKKHNNK